MLIYYTNIACWRKLLSKFTLHIISTTKECEKQYVGQSSLIFSVKFQDLNIHPLPIIELIKENNL